MTLPEHVIKWSCNFMEVNSSLYVNILPGLVVIGIVTLEMFLKSQDPTLPRVQRVVRLYAQKLLVVSPHTAKFGGIRLVVVEV